MSGDEHAMKRVMEDLQERFEKKARKLEDQVSSEKSRVNHLYWFKFSLAVVMALYHVVVSVLTIWSDYVMLDKAGELQLILNVFYLLCWYYDMCEEYNLARTMNTTIHATKEIEAYADRLKNRLAEKYQLEVLIETFGQPNVDEIARDVSLSVGEEMRRAVLLIARIVKIFSSSTVNEDDLTASASDIGLWKPLAMLGGLTSVSSAIGLINGNYETASLLLGYVGLMFYFFDCVHTRCVNLCEDAIERCVEEINSRVRVMRIEKCRQEAEFRAKSEGEDKNEDFQTEEDNAVAE